MDMLKKRMLMQLLLQDPVTEAGDPTARDYMGPGNNRPGSKINRYAPGSRDPGMSRDNPDLAPNRAEAEYSPVAAKPPLDSPYVPPEGADLQRLLELMKRFQGRAK
jgi:hypothetical protein